MKPIIIYRLGSLGDTIVALPCFNMLADVFSNYERIVLTNFPVSTSAIALDELLRPVGIINGVIEYPLGIRSLGSLYKLRQRIKLSGADQLIYLNAARGRFSVIRDCIFFYLCGIRTIKGAPLTSDLHNVRVDHTNKTEEMESARLARTMSELGPVDLSNLDSWSLKLGDDEFKSANKLLGGFKKHNYFAINFGGKAEEKDWGADNWIALISELSVKYHNCGLIILGSSAESDRAKELLNIWPYGGVNLCGVSSPRESACILANAIFFIGHDSGPLHLAASLQIPCIGLFGNYNSPIKWHPYGSRVSVLHEMRGINWITVEDVCYALEALLCLDIQ